MIAIQWQDGVLSLLDQTAYPETETWLTCQTVEDTAGVLSSGKILEEKIAAVAGGPMATARPPSPTRGS